MGTLVRFPVDNVGTFRTQEPVDFLGTAVRDRPLASIDLGFALDQISPFVVVIVLLEGNQPMYGVGCGIGWENVRI
ncbi:hypothetical protein ACFOZ7_05630 [Natribaculum luteum]|uniref:Uncharacterized protein n=1 Tax=Natribaculum luteum TaxID=1586232 RepID=A0ABD5NX04_9EURY|nr:hypothetical protein [Natribaculum luteum]